MQQVLRRLLVLSALFGVLTTALPGCSWSVGGGKGRVTNSSPTRGQELIDLQKARDTGAINQAEYENQKRRVLEQ